MDKKLYCGASKMKITPPLKLIPNLRGLMDKKLGGIVDDLYLRVIALSDGENTTLIISFDLDKAPNPKEYMDEISRHTQIPENNILYFGIHTHCAPITGTRPFERPNDMTKKPIEVQEATKEYEKFIMDVLMETVDDAIKKMEPAKMGYGTGTSYINVNRNQEYSFIDDNGKEQISCGLGYNKEAYVDPTLFVVKFENLNGKPIAFFINYAVHNVAMIWNNCIEDGKVAITSDIGGNVSRYMEEIYHDSTAVWSSGAAGDVNPIMMNELFYPDPVTGKVASTVLKEKETPQAILKVLASRHLADVLKVVKNINNMLEETEISTLVQWSKTPGRSLEGNENPEPYTVRLHLVRIGEVAFYGIGGELYSSLGKRVKEISPMKNTVIINHDASLMVNCGYIYDDDAFERNERYYGEFVGMGHSTMVPGYFRESLEEHTLQMFAQII